MVGISGIALIFYHLMNIPIGVSSIILNIPIALICYKALGKDFFVRSIRSIIITSLDVYKRQDQQTDHRQNDN